MPTIVPIPASATLHIRALVLRQGRPLADCHFVGDHAATTHHLGAMLNQRLVGIVSLMQSELADIDKHPSWQLRGMATLPEVRGQGLGKALVSYAINEARAQGYALLWCNAREHAVDFYKKFGFKIVGEKFEIPDVGPHFKLIYVL